MYMCVCVCVCVCVCIKHWTYKIHAQFLQNFTRYLIIYIFIYILNRQWNTKCKEDSLNILLFNYCQKILNSIHLQLFLIKNKITNKITNFYILLTNKYEIFNIKSYMMKKISFSNRFQHLMLHSFFIDWKFAGFEKINQHA